MGESRIEIFLLKTPAVPADLKGASQAYYDGVVNRSIVKWLVASLIFTQTREWACVIWRLWTEVDSVKGRKCCKMKIAVT